MKIKEIIPKPLKLWLIKVHYIPERIKFRIYILASQGMIPFPDKAFQNMDYKLYNGKKINFKNPKTYQEKLQWMKYYYRNPDYTQLVDKYEVREWVKNKIGEQYLVPLYGVYNNFEEIDFNDFPNKFVLKCTHDSGSVVICRNKDEFDFEDAKNILNKGLARNQFYLSREWPYKYVKPRIICEKYLEDNKIYDAPDYKFFCFDGKMKFFLINSERYSETGVKTNFYWPNFEKIEMKEADFDNYPQIDLMPAKINEMIHLAEILSEGMPHVRVDFNYVNNNIFFGEMTFYHCGGRKLFVPDCYNDIFGEYIHLPEKIRNK